jgi:hypothetical protein
MGECVLKTVGERVSPTERSVLCVYHSAVSVRVCGCARKKSWRERECVCGERRVAVLSSLTSLFCSALWLLFLPSLFKSSL